MPGQEPTIIGQSLVLEEHVPELLVFLDLVFIFIAQPSQQKLVAIALIQFHNQI
jgi:hypothetical protein